MLNFLFNFFNLKIKNIFFILLFSISAILAPIALKFLRIFMTKKRAEAILTFLGHMYKFLKFLAFVLGLSLFIALYDFTNFFSISGFTTAIVTLLGLIKINILDTLTHLFPSNGGVSEPSINSVIQEITESPIVLK